MCDLIQILSLLSYELTEMSFNDIHNYAYILAEWMKWGSLSL